MQISQIKKPFMLKNYKTKNNDKHKQDNNRKTIFQNISPLTLISLPIKALDNVVTVMCKYIPIEYRP